MGGIKQEEIIIRRCPSCAQPYDTEVDISGCIIQPEKCARCKCILPTLIFTSDGKQMPQTNCESKIRYCIK